jgi:hypothetical protein
MRRCGARDTSEADSWRLDSDEMVRVWLYVLTRLRLCHDMLKRANMRSKNDYEACRRGRRDCRMRPMRSPHIPAATRNLWRCATQASRLVPDPGLNSRRLYLPCQQSLGTVPVTSECLTLPYHQVPRAAYCIPTRPNFTATMQTYSRTLGFSNNGI